MADSYVCSGAIMRCTMGTSPAKLTVLPIRTVFLTSQPMANISDHLSMVNLAPFGLCRSMGFPSTASATAANHGTLTPMPCMHNTPFPWMNGKNDYIVKGDPALLKSSTCQCMWGGTISIIDDGQHGEGAQLVSKSQEEEFEIDQIKTDGLTADDILDGIQIALDVAGMAPVAGAIPDLANAAISALRGDWLGAGLSLAAAVPGAGDAVGAAKIAKDGVKIAKAAQKGAKAKEAAVEAAKGLEKIEKNADNVASLAEKRAAKLDKQIAESGNVSKLPVKKDNSPNVKEETNHKIPDDLKKRRDEKEFDRHKERFSQRRNDGQIKKEATNDAPSYNDYSFQTTPLKKSTSASGEVIGVSSNSSNTIRNSDSNYIGCGINSNSSGFNNRGSNGRNSSSQPLNKPSNERQLRNESKSLFPESNTDSYENSQSTTISERMEYEKIMKELKKTNISYKERKELIIRATEFLKKHGK